MVIDLILLGILLLFAILGLTRGFMKSVLNLAGALVTVFASILLARPIARFLDDIFNLAHHLQNTFTGEGTLNEIARNNGMLVLILFVAVALFLILRLLIWKLKNMADRVRASNKTISRTDSLLGLALGVARFFLYMSVFTAILLVLSNFQAIENIRNELLADTTFAAWLIEVCEQIVIPMIRSVGASAIE